MKDETSKKYYNAFITHFSQVFTACQTIASGRVKDEKETKLGQAAGYIDLVKDQISFFPGAGMILGALSKTLSAVSEHQKSQEVAAIGYFFTDAVTMRKFLRPLALKLAMEQESMLQALHQKGGQPSNVYGRLKEMMEKKDGIETLAIQHAANLLEAIITKQIKPNPSPTQKNIDFAAGLLTAKAITQPSLSRSSLPNSTSSLPISPSISGGYPNFLSNLKHGHFGSGQPKPPPPGKQRSK